MICSDRERQAPLSLIDVEITHMARYKFAIQFLNQKDLVLDAPCGSGYGTRYMSDKCNFIYGIDIFDGAISHANELFLNDNVNFCRCDMEKMFNLFPINNMFDKIISFEGIEHIKNDYVFLDEVYRLLKDEGLFIISTPRRPHGSPFHYKEYDLDEFKKLLQEKFIIKSMFGQVYDKFYDLEISEINPLDYVKFNFIAICEKIR